MRTMAGLSLMALALIVAPARADEKEAKFDASKLVGKWTYVSGMKNGTKSDEDNLKKGGVEFTKDTVTLTGDAKFVMKFTLDTAKTPVGIKLEMTESPFGAGAKAEGILEVKGDEMKFCYSPEEGSKAPTKFEAKEGSNHHFFVLKRAK